jgi:hypothetical protein
MAAVCPWAAAAELAGLPDLVRTKHTVFSIPFRVPKPQDAEKDAAAERVVLQVSKDLGGSWQPAGEAVPSAGSFTYRADGDGEYWFRLRAIDRQGRTRGGAGPDMRVLVDAAGPRLAGRVWKGPDGEIVLRYAAVDDSINLESLKVEYRTAGDPGWKTVAAEGILARQAPAHMVGEDIWWAGEKVESLTVRISVTDAAGNQTVRQFTLEPADPNVDQATLAAEIGVPPLPSGPGDSGAGGFSAVASNAPRTVGAGDRPNNSSSALPPSALSGSASSNGWAAEPAGAWSGGAPSASESSSGRTRGTTSSVLVHRPVDQVLGQGPNAWSLDTGPSEGPPLEYRGRPLQLSRSRRFAWEFDIPEPVNHGAAPRAVLWCTSDGGVTWQRAAEAADGRSPLDVLLPAAGLYGFRLELVAGTDAAQPRSGVEPESWVGIDEEPPSVDLIGVERLEEAGATTLVIRYTSRDSLPLPRSARLLYSPYPEGPWATIASGIDNQGEYRWQPDRGVPARVFLKLEVGDAAGNIGTGVSAEPVAVSTARATGRLGGLKPLPAP